MRKLLTIPLIAGFMSMTSCGAHKERNVQQLDFSNLDTTIAPGADYYDYATGGWQKNNPLKPEFARFGSFDLLRENNKEQLKELIETVTTTNNPQGSVAQKISNIYLAGLDSSKLNNDGLTPLAGILSEIDAINDKKSLSKFIGEANKFGEFPFLHFYVEADPMNSSMNLLQTYQNGMTLGEKDYYLSDEESMKNIRQEYLNYITKIFLMLGNSDDVAKAKALNILEMETELARASYSNVELRDPVKNYNKMNIEEFKSKYSGLDWNEVLTVNGLSSAKEISVGQIPYMEIMDVYISTAPLQTIKDYLTFQTVNGATGFLNDDLYNESFNFFGKVMSGKEEQEPRWKRALGTTNGILGEAVGQLYVEKFFPAEAKERMLTLVSNLQSSLGDRITNLDWMSDETKQKALEKLNTFTIKIGYPNKWRDYTNLEINKGDSYYDMVRKSNIFEWEYAISQNEKPVDKDKWYMSPQTVNAYYNPSSNEICFPAAILQPPFFYMNGDDAINYGAIGVVIGHEMTHGFDDQGRQFDKDGNIKDWWTEADAEKFDVKAKILVSQFDSIKVLDNLNANGSFTLGENIADQGGLVIAYDALKKQLALNNDPLTYGGFNDLQRFLLSYANIWAGNIRDEEIVRLTKIDPHSLGRWRVNGTLRNLDMFYEAFDIKEGDKMYMNPDERVVIW